MDILEKIKKAEQEASELKSGALAAAREKARESDKRCAEAAERIIDRANAEAAERLENAKKLADEKAAAFIADSAKADDAMADGARKRLPAAEEFIIKGVLG